MQISFFVCNKTAAWELIYTDIPFSSREFTLQEKAQEKTERFCINRALFSLKEDIWLGFRVCRGKIYFLKDDDRLYRLLKNGKEVREENYGKQACTVFSIVTIYRERLWLCLCLSGDMRAALYQTGEGAISLGRGMDNTVCCAGADMLSERHLSIGKNGQKAELLIEGRNGGYLNYRYLNRYERAALEYGDVIQIFGWTLIWLEGQLAIYSLSGEQATVRLEIYELKNDILRKWSEYGLMFSPAPRNTILPDKEVVELEFPPERLESEKQSLLLVIGPAFTMVLPMMLGFGAAVWNKGSGNGQILYTGLITAMASAVLGGFWAYLNVRQHREGMRVSERRRRVAYQNYIEDCEQKIKEQYRHHQNALRGRYPKIEDCMREAGGLPYLWNRTEQDADFLSCRIGVGELPFDVPIVIPKEHFTVLEDSIKGFPAQLKKKYGELKEVPACIDFRQERLCGVVACRMEDLAGLLWILALQISMACSAKQVGLACLFTKSKMSASCLKWLRWLPHLWVDEVLLFALDLIRTRDLIYQMEQLLNAPGKRKKYWIIFTDSYELIGRALLDNEQVSLLLFANDYKELPAECRSILLKSDDFSGQITLKAEAAFRREIYFDGVCRETAEAYARKLCGFAFGSVDVKEEIPQKVTIFELFGDQRINRAAICKSWSTERSEESLCVEIGMAGGNRGCSLDPHERGHGPHGLIAGMTGSGKSEMLQTIILSLALKYSPLEVGFFLIDYKGGGMSNLFAGLPHLLGSISNLSGGMVYRAMVSIRSENERRQRLFLSVSVNQIYEYQRLYRTGLVTIPLPHIFIIIDEFAELKREEPDFMRELVSVAQVGRSLGVHLILATQRPSGTVDDNIWSNARFRICLRVQDRQDSSEMLHRPDAAFLTNPGRAILQVGNDEVYEEFQGAYTMEPFLERGREKKAVYVLDEYGRKDSIYVPPQEAGESGGETKTQIKELLQEITRASDFMTVPKPESLWLPPLSEILYLEELHTAEKERGCQISIGRYDDPKHQKQGTYKISLSNGGHHVICGIAACGKSTFLQTILYSFIEQENPETLQIYIVDYSSSLLTGFEQSHLIGGVLTEEEQASLPKLFFLLKEMLLDRKKLFQGGSFLQYRAANKKAPPAILLVIDNYGGFREKTDGHYDEDMQELARFGESYGIYLLLTAFGIGGGEIPVRLFESCKTGICLQMSDKHRYCEALRAARLPLKLPENVKGRGIAWIKGALLEFQCALCIRSLNDFDRMEKLRQRIQQRNAGYPDRRAYRIPRIPDQPVLSEFFILLDETELKMGSLPVGYEEQSGRVYQIPFGQIRHVLVTGKRKTGKSNCLEVIKQTARRYGIFCTEVKSINELAEYVKENEEKIRQEKVPQEKTSQDFKEWSFLYLLPKFGKLCNEFYTNSYQKETESYLMEVLREKSFHKVIAIVRREDIGILSGKPLFEEMTQEVYGIHMGGALDGQSLFDFSYIPYSRQAIVKKAGCGMIPKCRQTAFFGEIILPLCEETINEICGHPGAAACKDH
ncbi:MAG: FtsK/SpoIIIE domain-containing protein [Lachnospiraceae bacterium]